jgi:hypothetical protein
MSCSSVRCKNRNLRPFTCARASIRDLSQSFISTLKPQSPGGEKD